jgi:hypothetical protein
MPLLPTKTFSDITNVACTSLIGLKANICKKKCWRESFFIHMCKIGIICWLPELKILVMGFTSPPPNRCHGLDLSPIKSLIIISK